MEKGFMRNFLMNIANAFVTLPTKISEKVPDGETKFEIESEIENMAKMFSNIMKRLVGPVFIVLGAAAALYTIYLGVMYAKAEDASKRKEVQGRLIGAAIGVVIILVGVTLVYAVQWDKITIDWFK